MARIFGTTAFAVTSPENDASRAETAHFNHGNPEISNRVDRSSEWIAKAIVNLNRNPIEIPSNHGSDIVTGFREPSFVRRARFTLPQRTPKTRSAH